MAGAYSHRLKGMKFMQRARDKRAAEKEREKAAVEAKAGTSSAEAEAPASESGGKGAKKGKAGKKGGRRVIYEADPLPKGRTTGRLSFGGSPKPAQVPGTAGGEDDRPGIPSGSMMPMGGPQYEAPAADADADASGGRKRAGGGDGNKIHKKPKV
uniref:Uncharacterized protein n=1 Tax=Chloropicon laureae TaxID=464258 RepID=A0A7S2Z3G2_9CHLO|mmetsp:Transcript_3397/g.8520  ORF Transcript_3397/g.8520 Transcript_3397/m.8520 type:complete len:155 (+) Transcript_3397:83-547(+)